MPFTTQPVAQTRRTSAKRFRYVLAGILSIAGLAVVAQLLWFNWWSQPEEPEQVTIKPAPSMGSYELPPPPDPEIVQVQVPAASGGRPPREQAVERPMQRVQATRRAEQRRAPRQLPRLKQVAWNIGQQELPNTGFRDGRRDKFAEGCALRPGVSFIPAKLVTAVNSEVEGQIVAEVMSPVYSPDYGYENKELVPRGTRLVGMLDKGERGLTLDRRRVNVAWTDMTMPGGRQIHLGRAFQAAADGSAGLGGRVDQRWGEVFVYAALATVFNILQRSAINNDNEYVDSAQREASRTLGDVGETVLDKSLDWEPIIVIDAGTQVRVLVNETLQVC
jgi:type IV secretory pathway VirB10-like protein